MALEIQRIVVNGIQSFKFCSIMADEITDVFNAEQLAKCFRWVTGDLEVNRTLCAT